MPGQGGLVLTGQLGDVMKESARIALTYVKSHASELGIEERILEGRELHVHVPAGAIPKDGPSAGITMVTAIASLLTRRPVKSTIGMTGEVTLQGRVLPIGGLKQKVLAAHAAGLTEVIVPERNQPDLDDVPSDVRDQMQFHIVGSVDQVLTLALGRPNSQWRHRGEIVGRRIAISLPRGRAWRSFIRRAAIVGFRGCLGAGFRLRPGDVDVIPSDPVGIEARSFPPSTPRARAWRSLNPDSRRVPQHHRSARFQPEGAAPPAGLHLIFVVVRAEARGSRKRLRRLASTRLVAAVRHVARRAPSVGRVVDS